MTDTRPKAEAEAEAEDKNLGHDSDLCGKSRKKEVAVAALLTATTISDAAKVAGVAEVTLFRWLRFDANFKAAYREARREVVTHTVCRLQQDSGKAVAVLCEVAEDASAPPSARVSAARSLIDLALRGTEIDDLAARIEALEEILKDGGIHAKQQSGPASGAP